MATPPPEATSILKEEKPQLPPSPNGAPAEEAGFSAVQGTADADANVPTNGTDGSGVVRDKPATANGTTDQPTFTNGLNATASPPKSPAVPPADSAPQPAPPAEEPKMDTPMDEMKMAGDQATRDQPNAQGESLDHAVESKSPEASAPESGVPANTVPATDMVSEDKPGNAAPENVASENVAPENTAPGNAVPETMASEDAPPENAIPEKVDAPEPLPADQAQDAKMETAPPPPPESAPVKTELPEPHPPTEPTTEASPGGDTAAVAPPVPPSQPLDQEMPDAPQAPMSPTKLSRERETDPSEEPAAKRTKTEGEEPAPSDFKVPELPTPTTEPPAESPMDGKPGMTKMQHKFLVKGIGSLKRMQHSRFYREPVDPVKLNIPHYPQVIKNPMDLGTIDRKLKNNEYPTPQAVVDDFNLMVNNSLTFNGPEHIVAQEGQSLKATFEKQMLKLPRPDEVEEKKPKKAPQKTSAARREPRTSAGQNAARPAGGSPQATTFALSPDGLPLIRRDSANPDGRPKRSIHPPKRDLPYSTKPKKKKYHWELKFCQDTLDELHKSKHYNYAAAFYYPVDPVALNIPNYHSVIKKPMDLSTMQSKLRTGQYEHAREFETDMRQMFKNCFKFNLPGDPTYVAGQRLEEVFNNKWAGKGRYLEAHQPAEEHQSASSSDEESEDDEESEAEDQQQTFTALQKQMAEISRQMEAMSQQKKKTPPGSKKAGKSKSGKKDPKDSKKSRTASLGKKDKKSKSSKSEKDRWVTYHEKQLISHGISSLPDKKMQEALKIIQSNVPALKSTQETEIELDIDELPNDVLLLLLKFVKKNAPQVIEDDDVDAPATNPAAPKPKKNKPMSKFEQEAQINMLESNLSRFQGGARSPDAMPSVEANESSDDSDDVTEESEEE